MRTASVLVSLCLAGAAAGQGEKKAPAGARALQALVAEYDAALAKFQKAYESAATAQDKQKVFRELHPRPADWAPRFMAIARKYPGGDGAVDALVWVVTHPVPAGTASSGLREQALLHLEREYPADARVGRLCTQLVHTADPSSEEFLRGLLTRSAARGVQARACTSLAVNLKFRARLITRLKEDREAVAGYEQALGKPAVRALLQRDPAALLRQSEKLFEQVVAKYGKLEHPTHGNLANLAKAHLLALRRPVAVDQPAPEIEGEAVDGKPLKLSDQRGKVVLLDFWGHAFAPCRAMYSYEKEQLERQASKPFVLLGINGDAGSREDAGKTMKAEGLTWRSWYDGGNTGGPIATRWEVDLWPTLFLIDHTGVVRHIFVGWPERKVMDKAIDALVNKAGK